VAEPVDFPEANLLLVGPEGSDIVPLPVLRHEGRIVSCWRLSPQDLRRVVETGEVWLSVWSGETAPPVLVTISKEHVIA
jgi:hypothetical protein